MRRLVCCLLALALVVAGCGDDDASGADTTLAPSRTDDTAQPTGDDETDQELDLSSVTLRVGMSAGSTNYQRVIMDASGAFDDAAYELQWVEFDSSRAVVEAMNAGAVDVGLSLQGTIAVLALGNSSPTWTADTAPFVLVGAEVPVADIGFSLLVPVDSEVESVEDLVGGRVALSPGAFGHYFFVRLMHDAGLSSGDIELVQLPPAENRAAFISGSVDGIVSGYRSMLPLVDAGHGRVVVSSSTMLEEYSLTYVRRQLLDDPRHEAAIGDMLERMERANRWTVDNVVAVSEIFETVAAMNTEDARNAAETVTQRRVQIDEAVVAAFQDQAEVFLGEGVVEQEVDVSILFDDRYNGSVPSE